MNIYISHNQNFDFQKQLIEPLEQSELGKKFKLLYLPKEPKDFESLTESGAIDPIIAEISAPLPEQEAKLSLANKAHIPVVCVYRSGSNLANSLKLIEGTFLEYKDSKEMVKKLINHYLNADRLADHPPLDTWPASDPSPSPNKQNQQNEHA